MERLFEFDQKLLRFWLWIHFKQFLSSQQLDPWLQDPSSLNVCIQMSVMWILDDSGYSFDLSSFHWFRAVGRGRRGLDVPQHVELLPTAQRVAVPGGCKWPRDLSIAMTTKMITVDALRRMPQYVRRLQCLVYHTRMSRIPHPHTPGNMWAARCNYVATHVKLDWPTVVSRCFKMRSEHAMAKAVSGASMQ